MFSSLVAAVFILSGVVLVNMLISTEEKTGSQIYSMVNSFELNDAAAMARADALQNFNYYFREELENYLTFDEYELEREPGFPLLNMQNYKNWPELVTNFERVVLLTDVNTAGKFDAAIDFVARRTIDQFHDGSYGKYHVSLSDRGNEAKNIMKQVISKAIREEEKILEVVGCEGESYCPIGTFYFNINLSEVDPVEFEKLPRIIVKDIITGEEIKISVLPKSNLKIYVPLRFFKAMSESIKHARAISDIEDDLINARIGFCGDGCTPTSDFLNVDDGDDWDHPCPGSSSEGASHNLSGADLAGWSSYNPGGGGAGILPLNAFAKSRICESSSSIDAIPDPVFKNDNFISGLILDGASGRINIKNCAYNTITASVEYSESKIISGSGVGKLYCSQIMGTESQVVFEETNPKYIVSGEKNYYKIKITTGPYDKMPSMSGTCQSGDTSDSQVCKRI